MRCPYCRKTIRRVEVHVDYVIEATKTKAGDYDVDMGSKTVDIYSGCSYCGELLDSPVPLTYELTLVKSLPEDAPLVDILFAKLDDHERALLSRAYYDGGLDSIIPTMNVD